MSKCEVNTDISAAVKAITESKFKPIKSSAEKPVQGICIANFKYAPLNIINQASNTLRDHENINKNSGEKKNGEIYVQSEHAQTEQKNKLPRSTTDFSFPKENSLLQSNGSDIVKTDTLSVLKEKTVEKPKQNTGIYVQSEHSYSHLFYGQSDHNYSNMSHGQSEQIEKLPVSNSSCIIPKQKSLLQQNDSYGDQNEPGPVLQNKKIDKPKLILPKGITNHSQFGLVINQQKTVSSNMLKGHSNTSLRFHSPLVLPQNTNTKTPLLILWRPPSTN